MLNINIGHNEELLKACKTLRDYSEYVRRVRMYAKGRKTDEAVEQAITECIREGILAEFLEKNRAEAKKVSIYEYDAEEHMRMEREESFEEGYRDGHRDGQEAERVNTERERRRADEAEMKLKELEAEIARLKGRG